MNKELKAGMVAGVIGKGFSSVVTENVQRKAKELYGFSDKDCMITHVAPIIHPRGTILEMTHKGPRFNNLRNCVQYRLFDCPVLDDEQRKEFGYKAFELSHIENLDAMMRYDYLRLASQWFIANGMPYEVDAKGRDICSEFYFHIMVAIGVPLPTECMYPAILGVLARSGTLMEIEQ